MSPIGQRKSNYQNYLQSTSLKSGIGKEIDLTQQQYILLLSNQLPCHMDHNPYFHPYSSWGWFDQETHVSSYFRPQYIEYAAPRHSEGSSSCKDQFDQNRSGAQPKKKVVKQVYRVKYDGRKKKSSDLNSTIEKPTILLKNSAIDDKEVGKSSIDILGAKSKQKKVKVPKIKKDLPLSKIEIKPICSIG